MGWDAGQGRLGGDHEARRAEAALLRVIVNKSLLYGMKLARFAETFHGRDLLALRVDGQHGARVHGFAVQQHGACAAGAAIAHALGAGEVKLVSQRVEQRDARLKLRIELLAVHVERDRNFSRTLNVRRFIKRKRADLGHQWYGRRHTGNFQKITPGNSRAGR